jgi:hypothetical protein
MARKLCLILLTFSIEALGSQKSEAALADEDGRGFKLARHLASRFLQHGCVKKEMS